MPKKIVLAYSGGLDTSVILKWLQNKYNCPVVTFTADIGQGEELSPVETKAKSLGVEEIFIENLQEEFVRDYVFPMFRANALYEGNYLLGTAIARPLISPISIIFRFTGINLIYPVASIDFVSINSSVFEPLEVLYWETKFFGINLKNFH